jgi:chemotaxis protein MotB
MAGMPPPIKSDSGSNEDEWLITYADAITLLMAFFVIMFSITEPNTEKFEQVTKGMVETLSRQEVQSPFADLRKDLNSVSAESGEQAQVDTVRQERVTRFASDDMFAPGSADILPSGQAPLDRVAELLVLRLGRVYQVEVRGHTDRDPISTPRYASNWELSAARAAAVVRYLEAQGVDKRRMRAVGMADTDPVLGSDGQPLEDKTQQRRVEIKIER